MKKIIINYWVDFGLAIVFIVSLLTGIIKWPSLLPTLGVRYSSLPMRIISTIHDWSGLIMGLLVLIHLILHWKWIVVMTKKTFGQKRGQK